MSKLTKRVMAMLLAVSMLLSMVTTMVFAAEDTTGTINPSEQTNVPYEASSPVIRGEKVWVDDKNTMGSRPETITVRLYADGMEIASTTTSEQENWKYSFDISNVPLYNDDGSFVVFTVSEDAVPNYSTSYQQPLLTITPPQIREGGKVTPCSELIIDKMYSTITIVKKGNHSVIWTMENLNEHERDALLADININGINKNNVTFIFGEGTQYEGITVGKNVISFSKSSDWSWFYVGEFVASSIESTPSVITNTLETIEFAAEKIWDDNNNQDGIRPESITVKLLANGKDTGKTLELSSDNNWKGIFENLLAYDANGSTINYSLEEIDVDGYDSTIDGSQITNTHVPEIIVIEGTKTWIDNNNQDGIRPESIIINLFVGDEKIDSVEVKEINGEWKYSFGNLPKYENGQLIKYTILEEAVAGYDASYDGYNVTNTHVPETIVIEGTKTWIDNNNQDGIRPESIIINLLVGDEKIDSVEVKEINGEWKYSFNNLPMYENGQLIKYTILEESVVGYDASYDGYNVTNTHVPETFSIEGTKTWIDNNNQDGIRPESIIINLLVGDEKIDSVEVKEINGEWKYSFNNLPMYENGQLIKYTILEEAVAGYDASYEGYNVTNTHVPETIVIEGTKTWIDNNNQDGIRPESIIINLLVGDEKIDSVEVKEINGEWKYSFNNLPKYENGQLIKYTIREEAVAGYDASYDGYNVTNTHVPETIVIEGTKTWIDNNNQDGIRPESIIINLLVGDEKIDSVEVKEINGEWKYSFDNLPKYENGKLIEYTIREEAVAGYTVNYDGYNVTNTHIPAAVVSLGGIKYLDKIPTEGYEFQITLPDGSTLNAISGTDGIFSFGEFRFEAEGTYQYVIREVIGTDTLIEYDTSVYVVTIDVKLENGAWTAQVTVLKDGQEYEGQIEFNNTSLADFDDELPPGAPLPPVTGDSFNRIWFLMAILSSMLIITEVVIFRKKLVCKK